MSWPASTAIPTCTRNAAEAPSQTHSGAPRAPMSSVATIVLSGSSAMPMTTKTVPTVAQSTAARQRASCPARVGATRSANATPVSMRSMACSTCRWPESTGCARWNVATRSANARSEMNVVIDVTR